MTAQEMHYHFELKLNQFHSIEKVFTSADVNVFLNQAQQDIIEDRYSKKDGHPGHYFETDEKTRLELGSLISNYIVNTGSFDTTNTALHDNAVMVNLPSDFLYSIQEMCSVVYEDCNDETASSQARVLPIRHDEYAMNIENPFMKPYKKLVWRMDYGSTGTKRHELIYGDGDYISRYTLRYIKSPSAININTGADCQLHVNLHEEIVDRAVNIAVTMVNQLNAKKQKTETE